MTTELFLGSLTILTLAALIILVLTSSKGQRDTRNSGWPDGRADDRNAKARDETATH